MSSERLELSDEALTWINDMKALEVKVLEHLAKAPADVSGRWQAVAKTHFQEGRMAAVRSVTEK